MCLRFPLINLGFHKPRYEHAHNVVITSAAGAAPAANTCTHFLLCVLIPNGAARRRAGLRHSACWRRGGAAGESQALCILI